ncbi:CHASE2 domain-containing protein [Oscillatoria acuminata]|uniref:histidine kinase n=1 Tax=Oscillatoria acuminata PCC 6304 TaxID=56110 RepID=K9TQC2_9CYAN|nr:CHASE2 domain-containing protein [Oscillatoria acuminata]AFY84608.1 putative transmembrane sensor domain protein [Oscillatoria acuminata PCC 6304]
MWAKVKRKIWEWRKVSILAPTVAGLAILLRMSGLLQALEFSTLDLLFQLRPVQPPDPRILIVGINENDLTTLGNWPIPDNVLAELLEKIKAQEPKAIGLDIYRDMPVGQGFEQLKTVFETTPNLIGIRKVVGNQQQAEIAPSPILDSLDQVGANDFPWDMDNKIRRGFLYLSDEEGTLVFSLAFKLAMIYLEGEGIAPQMKDETRIELGKAVFSPLRPYDGGYVRASDEGYQILLNYRGPQGSFDTISLMDVLENRIPPDLMRDRIVLIGSTAISLKDFSLTPYSNTLSGIPEAMAGIEIHANLTSHLIAAALEGESKIHTASEGVEWLWIFLWGVVGAGFTCQWRDIKGLPYISFPRTGVMISLASLVLIVTVYSAFMLSWWIPLVPPLLALIGSAIATIGYTLLENLQLSYKQIEEYSRTLEVKVEQRTVELRDKNQQLKLTLKQLKAAQKQMIAQEKLASLGSLAAGIAHEIRNPLNFVNNFASISVDLTEELIEELDNPRDNLEDLDVEYLNETLTDLKDSVVDIKQHGERIEKIVEGMLLLSQAERGQRSRVNLHAILSEAIELASHSYQNKDTNFSIAIETDYDEAISEIYIVPQDMSRAFLNLVNNACYALYEKYQADPDGYRPTLTVKTRTSSDRPTEPKRDPGVEIRIRDNGPGIPEEILDQIFNPFFTTKPTGEGTGLGLSLTYETIVGQHGGQLEVNSHPGDHTEFMIILPQTTASN